MLGELSVQRYSFLGIDVKQALKVCSFQGLKGGCFLNNVRSGKLNEMLVG